MKLLINSASGYTSGQVVTVQVDSNGIPLEQFWRKRLKDALVDNCVEVVKASKPKKGKSK